MAAKELMDETLKITPLGAGTEVGRSCIIVEYKGRKIMLDCGIHPAHRGIASLPYFDEIDPSSLDLILITHFHLDHSAALPYFLSKTDFKGRVFMTHPTKSIYLLLLQDFIRVSSISTPDPLFDEIDLNNSMDRIETVNFHQVVNVKGIKFWAYNAGHVLGAAMFMIEIAGVKILYTGDYSRKDDRHLTGAELPEVKPDVLIIESTYGIQRLDPIERREQNFTQLVQTILERGGRCLIPVFALGRAQELLLIIDEHWKKHPDLHSYPVYYASSLAKKCMTVYKTYTNMMNERVQKQTETENPFDFSHIRFLSGMKDFHDIGPSVVFASPGMLQSGFSRQLFEEWCGDPRNGIIIPGYIVEGTLAKSIMMEPEKIESMSGQQLPLNMSIHYVTFSAHADFSETSDFVEVLSPPHIILVHGDSNEMNRLNKALTIQVRGKKTQISTPRNCQTVELEFGSEKVAKVVGRLAENAPGENDVIEGVLVLKDYSMTIMHKEDIEKFTPLVCSSIFQSISVSFNFSFDCLKWLVGEVYSVEEQKVEKSDFRTLIVSQNIKLSYCKRRGQVVVEWMSSPLCDLVADSVMALMANAETLSTKAISRLIRRSGGERDLKAKVEMALKSCFGVRSVRALLNGSWEFEVDGLTIIVHSDFKVEGENEEIVKEVEKIIKSCMESAEKIKLPRMSTSLIENSATFVKKKKEK